MQQRANILATPQGRAALLYGGIVARLAREHFDNDVAALGPSSAVTTLNIGYVVTTLDGDLYIDDVLTKNEINIICGLHRCLTGVFLLLLLSSDHLNASIGNGSQEALLSWWPLPHVWYNRTNGYYWGHWTEIDEQWFPEASKPHPRRG